MNKWLLGSILALILLLGGLFWALKWARSPDPGRHGDFPDQIDKLAPELNITPKTSLEDWIDKLAKYEACPPQGIKDRNGRYSYGPFCYQMDTFLWFMKYFRNKGYALAANAEEAELPNLISDPELQKQLTRLVFEDNLGNWTHWYTSVAVRGLGLPPGLD